MSCLKKLTWKKYQRLRMNYKKAIMEQICQKKYDEEKVKKAQYRLDAFIQTQILLQQGEKRPDIVMIKE